MKKFNKLSIGTALAISFMFAVSSVATLAAGPATVNLGSAGDFVVLSKSGISTTGTTSITGDIGVSPITAAAMTGFGLIMDSSNTFSTSSLLTGKAYAADYTAPTPVKMTTAVSNMETAYTDAAGRTNPTATELGAGNIGGMTLTPGLYKWSTGVTIPTDITLSGSSNDIWIFQVAQNLTISSATKVILSGGAQASNVFWQVVGQTILGTNSVFSGNILDQSAIVLNTGAILNGRALAQTAVTLDANMVSIPSISTPVSTPVPTATISANPISIIHGNSSTISWSSSNAVSCFGTNFSTGNTVSGSVNVSPISNTTYSVNCDGASDSVVVTVVPISTPTTTPILTPINGLCYSSHYSCNIGTSANNISGSTEWTWVCEGLNGGIIASCSEIKPAIPTSTPIPTTITPTTKSTTLIPVSTQSTTTLTSTETPISDSVFAKVPSLPNAGIGPDEKSITWNLVIASGIFIVLTLFYFIRRKQRV